MTTGLEKYLNRIICRDCMDVIRELPDKCIDLVLTDPMYGIKVGGAKPFGKVGGGNPHGRPTTGKVKGSIKPTEFVMFDDSKPPSKEYFDEILRISVNQIIFGGNYFTDKLPPSPCWIVWDKDTTGNFADCELAWTSFPSAVRIFRHRWNGLLQEDMAHKEKRTHPTQKPLKLMEWCLQKYSKPGDIIFDPYMGSGPTIEAAAKLQRPFIGTDICQEYCDMAQRRLDRVNNRRLTDFGELVSA